MRLLNVFRRLVRVRDRPDSVGCCGFTQTIHAGICLCVRLWHLHRRSRPFHPVLCFSAPLMVQCSAEAVSFLLRSSPSQEYSFRNLAFVDVRTFLRIKVHKTPTVSCCSTSLRLAFANLMANSEASSLTLKIQIIDRF